MQGQWGPVLGGRRERRAPGSQGPPPAPSTPAHGGLPWAPTCSLQAPHQRLLPSGSQAWVSTHLCSYRAPMAYRPVPLGSHRSLAGRGAAPQQATLPLTGLGGKKGRVETPQHQDGPPSSSCGAPAARRPLLLDLSSPSWPSGPALLPQLEGDDFTLAESRIQRHTVFT